MSHPRGLTAEEQAAWERLAQSVVPLAGRSVPTAPSSALRNTTAPVQPQPKPVAPKPAQPVPGARKVMAHRLSPPPARRTHSELDSHWDRKLKAGQVAPDYTLDLHGHTLDAAYDRITSGLDQARAMNARLVLVIAGRSRPVDPADRGSKRGAIRAKLLDWIAASHHADAVVAVRKAHRRHGGEGALYLVLKRRR
ncbi:MAG: Smr/MutS family protein [Pseudomonadota bacterium]